MKYLLLVISFLPTVLFSQQLDTLLLHSNILEKSITSFILDYKPKDTASIFYLTDGKKMIENEALEIIDSLTNCGAIPKAKYIFVSTIDPQTGEDFRNDYFFCNPNYVHFFEQELIPYIEKGTKAQTKRHLIGLSFGGLNAAFFAAQSSLFSGYALLSPITYPCTSINEQLIFSIFSGYKVYISTGKKDAESYVEELYPILKLKTDTIKLMHTKGGHDFENWNQQLEAIFNFLK